MRSSTSARTAGTVVSLAALAAVGGAALAGPTAVAGTDRDDEGRTVLKATSMAGVPLAYTGTRAPLRELNGGGLPWTIDRAEVKLRLDGSLRVKVRGLVLADIAAVPAGLRGTNPVPAFKALLSCQSATGGVAPVANVVNVSTGAFPATTTGDADIRANVVIPRPCLAPVVFVTSPTGSWFAVTGSD